MSIEHVSSSFSFNFSVPKRIASSISIQNLKKNCDGFRFPAHIFCLLFFLCNFILKQNEWVNIVYLNEFYDINLRKINKQNQFFAEDEDGDELVKMHHKYNPLGSTNRPKTKQKTFNNK